MKKETAERKERQEEGHEDVIERKRNLQNNGRKEGRKEGERCVHTG